MLFLLYVRRTITVYGTTDHRRWAQVTEMVSNFWDMSWSELIWGVHRQTPSVYWPWVSAPRRPMHRSLSDGNWSQRSMSGQGKPYLSIRSTQPALTASHSERHGHTGRSRQTGANNEHRNTCTPITDSHNLWLRGVTVGCRTYDWEVKGSTSAWVVIKRSLLGCVTAYLRKGKPFR